MLNTCTLGGKDLSGTVALVVGYSYCELRHLVQGVAYSVTVLALLVQYTTVCTGKVQYEKSVCTLLRHCTSCPTWYGVSV